MPSISRRGELPRQCRGRDLLRRPEEEADQAADLPDMRHSELGRVRRNRDVLQPDPPVWFRWRVVTGRVSKALRAERQLSVYGNLAGPSADERGWGRSNLMIRPRDRG